jgi:hypothetical protein
MTATVMKAQDLTCQLLAELSQEHPDNSIPALIVAAVKLAVATRSDADLLGKLLLLVRATYEDEHDRHPQVRRNA